MRIPLLPTACLALAAVAATISPNANAAHRGKTYVFHAQRNAGAVNRVAVLLEVGGETIYINKQKSQREKLGIVCGLEYLEKTIVPSDQTESIYGAVRQYKKVATAVKIGEDRFEPKLAPEHRTIVVNASERAATLFSPGGSLSREELDAVDIHFNTLLLDRLLPSGPVASGQSWPLDDDLLAIMLGLDEVEKSTVEATLKEATGTLARFELSGRVEGRVLGARTEIELKGRYRFDCRAKQVDWLGALIKENRRPSEVADGLDVVSRLQITVSPAAGQEILAGSTLDESAVAPASEATYLTHDFQGAGCRCKYDRQWFVDDALDIMRLMDRGTIIGQCNITKLPKQGAERLVSLEDFQDDVRKALGENFGEFVSAKQSVNRNGLRVLRVAVDGAVSGQPDRVPIRWTYYHLADREGRQTALTFTVEQENMEQFADADEPIVGSLRFFDQ